MHNPVLEIKIDDPRSPEATALIRELSQELARRYDDIDDGSGDFKAEDVLIPRSGFVVGSTEGYAVACGAFRPLEDMVAEIKRMYVKPSYRGQGYARLILLELERLIWEQGYASIRLETGTRQPEAIGLYERLGYEHIANFGIYVDSDLSVCFEKHRPASQSMPQ